jgi:hypothetical protein
MNVGIRERAIFLSMLNKSKNDDAELVLKKRNLELLPLR